MADELIDIVDENNNLTGIQKMKSEAHCDGLWHRTAHIWVYNSKAELLIQLRAKDKDVFPDVWDISVAGHVGAGEDVLASALREIKEEIGLTAKEEDLDLLSIKKVEDTYKEIKNNEFYNIYLLKFDGDISSLKIQEEEVQEIKFISTNDLKEDLNSNYNKYCPHGDYWFEVIKAVEQKLGNIS